MIRLFAMIVSVFYVWQPLTSMACSPSPTALGNQSTSLSKILKSDVVWAEMRELAGENAIFQSMETTAKGYKILLSNDCEIEVQGRWQQSTMPGMCSRFEGFEIIDSVCSK